MPEAIRFTADVELEAAAAEATGPRKFAVKAYTGGELRVARYDLPVVVDLAGLQAAKSIKANMDHDQKLRVGHVTDVQNDGKTLSLSGVVSATGAAAKEFQADAELGYPFQASIEATPGKLNEIPAGETVEVNGRTFKGPVIVARKAKLFGVAFLARGADENTTVSIAATAANTTKGNAMKFEQWIEAMGFDTDSLSDKQRDALKAKYDSEVNAAGGEAAIKAAPEFDLDELKAAASEHVANLEVVFAEHEGNVSDSKKFAELKAGALKAARELKSKSIKERWSAARFEVEAIKAASKVELDMVRAEAPAGPAIHSRDNAVTPDVLEAALCLSSKLPNVEKHFKEETLEAANRQYRGIGLQEFLILAAAQNGLHLGPGKRIHDGNLRQVLAAALPPVYATGGASTMGVSTSNILSNVATKELNEGYMEQDQTWREISRVKSVRDFKQMTAYRLLDNMVYEEVGPSGEIKHGTVSQESYTRQAKTYAKMFAITRTDIINDDMGAFDDIRTRLGGGASMKLNDVFWTNFLADSSFFTSGNGNYITGSTTTLLTDGVGLQLAITKFFQMASASGDGSKRIGGQPVLLLVPPELQYAAQRLYQSTNIASGTADMTPDANIHAAKYRPVVSPWLSDTSVSGYSTTGWYLFRDPAILPAMVVSFLNGQETPTVESADADFDVLGVQFRGYHDFGCDLAEYLCGVKSKGAA